MRHMTNFATKAEIYSYDINHKTSSLIYEYTNPQGDIYLNELRANEKNLFWEIINPSQNWGLYKFDL